jgi:hypothetical protein
MFFPGEILKPLKKCKHIYTKIFRKEFGKLWSHYGFVMLFSLQTHSSLTLDRGAVTPVPRVML